MPLRRNSNVVNRLSRDSLFPCMRSTGVRVFRKSVPFLLVSPIMCGNLSIHAACFERLSHEPQAFLDPLGSVKAHGL